MKTKAKKVVKEYLVAVRIDDQTEIFKFPTKRNQEAFFKVCVARGVEAIKTV